MQTLTEPKIIAGNSNMSLASAITRRMSMHRGKLLEVVDARIERFNDQEIFIEVYENVRGEDMFIVDYGRCSKAFVSLQDHSCNSLLWICKAG